MIDLQKYVEKVLRHEWSQLYHTKIQGNRLTDLTFEEWLKQQDLLVDEPLEVKGELHIYKCIFCGHSNSNKASLSPDCQICGKPMKFEKRMFIKE